MMVRRTLHALGLLICFALAGCNSTRFGAILRPAQRKELTAPRLGPPSEGIAPVAVEEQPAPAEDPVPIADESGRAQVIDLPSALRLGGAENPTIALAEEVVRGAEADRMQARALLFPSLQFGGNLRVHRGYLQNSSGRIIESNLQSLYYGFGADAKGSGTPLAPGLRLLSPLADAVYAPHAAQQKVVENQFVAVNTRNEILRDVGISYLELARQQARLQAFRQSLTEYGEVERLTANQAARGQGRESDAQRARSDTLLLRAQAQQAQEELDVAAADLARLLHLDPSLRLRPVDEVPPLIQLVDPHRTVESLVQQAIVNHPELAARSAEVRFQEIRLRQEYARPFLPTVGVGVSYGDFGGGSQNTTPSFGNFAGRFDFDVFAAWSLQNLGLGNHAIQNRIRANRQLAQVEEMRALDRIRDAIAEAVALAQARKREMQLARQRLATSQAGFREDLNRALALQARPIEVLNSARLLSDARQDYVRAVTEFTQAQLQLYVALGNPPPAE
jgi:outer membrane protein TolC